MSHSCVLLPSAPMSLMGPRCDSEQEAKAQGALLVMGMHEGALSLWSPTEKSSPLAVNFSEGKQGYRLAQERARHETLVKALGKPKEGESFRVLDATAGLGRDAAIMAAAGFSVDLRERSPWVHALLVDGLQRAPELLQSAMRLLPCGDNIENAEGEESVSADGTSDDSSNTVNDPPYHAIYLDPMFPARQKSAAVKKDLRWLQMLCEYPSEHEELAMLAWAKALGPKRIVVKRPAKAPNLANSKPSFSYKGKAVRFDVYL